MAAVLDLEKIRQPGSRVLEEWVKTKAPSVIKARERAIQEKRAQAQRMFGGADMGRLTSDWTVLNTSADSEIITSLRALRSRSRALVRDNDYAKNAVRIIKNNVIGTGIGMQAQVTNSRGKLVDSLNDRIEDGWSRWTRAKNCHTAGLLDFQDIESVIVGQLAEAGEVLIRKVRAPFGDLRTPLALEVIEADRLMDTWSSAVAPNGNSIRMGVEVDRWGRPAAYWLYPGHPGDYQFSTFQPSAFIRVPADEMIHLYIIDRWPQTRGVPWFHSTLFRLHNSAEYENAEIVAARAAALIVGFITTPDTAPGDAVVNNQRMMDMAPGMFRQLLPGERFEGFNPSRPNSALDPFMRYMLRGVAAGVGTSYESLSRDYSQSNYSSSRLALLDDRDLWRVLQGFVIRKFRAELHREWLRLAVLAGDVNLPGFESAPEKYEAVRFRPRGWSWIDPAKEVEAYKSAVRAGFMTVTDVIAATGNGADADDVFRARRRELDKMQELKLVFDTDPAQVNAKGQAQVTPDTAPTENTTTSNSATTEKPDGDTDESPDE